jgi:hypothetical protein
MKELSKEEALLAARHLHGSEIEVASDSLAAAARLAHPGYDWLYNLSLPTRALFTNLLRNGELDFTVT